MNASLHLTDLHVGRRIKARRLEIGLSQSALGAALGVRFQQIGKYERAKNDSACSPTISSRISPGFEEAVR